MGPIVLASLLWSLAAPAAPEIVVVAVESPAWTARNGSETALATGDRIEYGYRLLTGDTGKLALQLGPGVNLQIDVDSEIEFIEDADAETAAAETRSAVKIHRGRLCAQFRYRPETAIRFSLQLGKLASAAIRDQGQLCAVLGGDDSRIALVGGSVQITNLVENTLVVLSKPGSDYRFDDSGHFELGMTRTDIAIEVGEVSAPVTEPLVRDESRDSATEKTESTETETTSNDAGALSEPAIDESKPGQIYTVYLFSTRSQTIANEVNRKLRDAGHQTRIIASNSGTTTQYRIAVSGFTSRQAAQDYSAAIVGKYGIEDTWIGRKKAGE